MVRFLIPGVWRTNKCQRGYAIRKPICYLWANKTDFQIILHNLYIWKHSFHPFLKSNKAKYQGTWKLRNWMTDHWTWRRLPEIPPLSPSVIHCSLNNGHLIVNFIVSGKFGCECTQDELRTDWDHSDHTRRWSGLLMATFFCQRGRECVLVHTEGPPTQLTPSALVEICSDLHVNGLISKCETRTRQEQEQVNTMPTWIDWMPAHHGLCRLLLLPLISARLGVGGAVLPPTG